MVGDDTEGNVERNLLELGARRKILVSSHGEPMRRFLGGNFDDVSARFAGSFQRLGTSTFATASWQRAFVFFAGQFFQLIEDRAENSVS